MSKNCGNCHWFKTKYKIGENDFCCADFGTQDWHDSCGDFQSGEFAANQNPEAILDDIKQSFGPYNPNSVSQKDSLVEIITDIFNMEQDVNIVVEKVKLEIEKQGYYLPFKTNTITNLTGKLSDLFLLHRLTLSFGLGSYLEEIMRFQIEKSFSDPRKYGPIQKRPFSNSQERIKNRE